MEHKLLAFVSRRTAWIVLGSCVAFWLLLAVGVLELPVNAPPAMTFLWMYFSLLVALASTVAAAAAVAILVLHGVSTRAAAEDNTPG